MKYSNTTKSFYAPELDYQNPPTDLIEVAPELYAQAVAARANGASLSLVAGALVIIAAPVPTPKTVLELDTEKYLRRANAKPLLMAKMAAMNVGRLKTGTWTTAQLVSLMADPEIKSLVSHMETLSFELAISVINGLTNPIITPAIKSTWVAELTAAL